MKILCLADLHDNVKALTPPPDNIDVLVWAGDNLADIPYHYSGWTEPELAAREYQRDAVLSGDLPEVLKGRPFICVPGNHDKLDLAFYKTQGAITDCIVDISNPAAPIKAHMLSANIAIAGFTGVPRINGKYFPHEADERALYEAAFTALDELISSDADHLILVSHTPPFKIMDSRGGEQVGSVGVTLALTTCLDYLSGHRHLYHVFGHIHEHGGGCDEQDWLNSYNVATRPRILEIPDA